MITNYDTQVLAYKNMTSSLQKDLNKTKTKLFYNRLILVTGISALTYLYVTK